MRSPIQTLTEAKDSITAVVLTDHTLLTGSVDGFVREYDLRAGQLREDYIGRQSSPTFSFTLPQPPPSLYSRAFVADLVLALANSTDPF